MLQADISLAFAPNTTEGTVNQTDLNVKDLREHLPPNSFSNGWRIPSAQHGIIHFRLSPVCQSMPKCRFAHLGMGFHQTLSILQRWLQDEKTCLYSCPPPNQQNSSWCLGQKVTGQLNYRFKDRWTSPFGEGNKQKAKPNFPSGVNKSPHLVSKFNSICSWIIDSNGGGGRQQPSSDALAYWRLLHINLQAALLTKPKPNKVLFGVSRGIHVPGAAF